MKGSFLKERRFEMVWIGEEIWVVNWIVVVLVGEANHQILEGKAF